MRAVPAGYCCLFCASERGNPPDRVELLAQPSRLMDYVVKYNIDCARMADSQGCLTLSPTLENCLSVSGEMTEDNK